MIQKKLFIIEDEPDMRNLLEFILTSEGYMVYSYPTGEEAIEAINLNPDLILLDIMLPGTNGLEICKAIKSNKNTKNIYTIILTSKADEFDVLNGIYCGCDDYITKPFSQKILLAKIKSIFKKKDEKNGVRNIIKINELEIDPDRFKASISGVHINFTPSEFKLLHFLAKNDGQVYNRDKLYDVIHEYDDNAVDRSVDILIARIRKKLGKYSNYIESIYGVGYKFIRNNG